MLHLALAPTLDVGCGPGRHVIELTRRGVPAVGIDNAVGAVRAARRRGAQVIHRSIFDRVPDEGPWGSVLLMDGNLGIGGDPERLLGRCRRVLRRGGRVLAEVEPPGARTQALEVRAAWATGRTGWFPWAQVGADDVGSLASASGLELAELWSDRDRWFARLDRR